MISKADSTRIALENYKDIYCFCLSKFNNTDVAKDVSQEVFLLFQEKGDVLEDDNIRSWLFSVAEKILHEKMREFSGAEIISFEDERYPAEPLIPFEEIYEEYEPSDAEIEFAKEKLIKKLHPEERELFELLYRKNVSVNLVAQELGISRSAVSMRALRLRKKIKKLARAAFLLIFLILAKLDI
ncbi:MAG: sigma-70 family RNA polymerase sigma factor [Clostridiales bacterium]|nr:sigma-70 family RNA polymerase sigma factor [Clostridiales bacterium]